MVHVIAKSIYCCARDMVAAAHLKPLEKKDHIDDKFMQPWNSLASKQSAGTSTNATTAKLKVIFPEKCIDIF